ncbi:MAG TPA: response regulator [Bacteroidales bacterium]|nr:response regulator [Bacteroidales bacterium]
MEKDVTLLYVDDETINLKLFEINFSKKFNVITAPSGYDALEKLKDSPSISVIISDMRMPGMNGIDFIKLAKEQRENVDCFILSGYDVTEEINNAYNERLIDRYFQKPFNMRDIESSIKEAIELRIKSHTGQSCENV